MKRGDSEEGRENGIGVAEKRGRRGVTLITDECRDGLKGGSERVRGRQKKDGKSCSGISLPHNLPLQMQV